MAYELFFDGFEHYSARDDLTQFFQYTQLSPQAQLNATGGRRSSQGLRCYGQNRALLQRSLTASSHVVWGMALKPANSWPFNLNFLNGATAHATLTVYPNNKLVLSVGGVQVDEVPVLLPLNTWMYLELGVAVANSGGTWEVRVNGSSAGVIPPGIGDTQNGTTSTINAWSLTTVTFDWPDVMIDDLYLTYGNELRWLGDSRIDKLLLTANSTPQDWTPDTGNAWERLNAGTGYITSSTDEATSLFEFADLPYTPEAIHGLAVRARMLKSNTNFRSACTMIKSAGTESEGAELALSTDALGQLLLLKQDPATASPWTYEGIRDALVGVRVKG